MSPLQASAQARNASTLRAMSFDTARRSAAATAALSMTGGAISASSAPANRRSRISRVAWSSDWPSSSAASAVFTSTSAPSASRSTDAGTSVWPVIPRRCMAPRVASRAGAPSRRRSAVRSSAISSAMRSRAASASARLRGPAAASRRTRSSSAWRATSRTISATASGVSSCTAHCDMISISARSIAAIRAAARFIASGRRFVRSERDRNSGAPRSTSRFGSRRRNWKTPPRRQR